MTPTYRGDFDRFALLRESITAFGQGHVRHYALVDTEDLPLLESLRLPNVQALATERILPPEVEAGRLAYKRSGGRTRKRLMRSLDKRLRCFPVARFYGWQIQQLLKLAAPTVLPEKVFVSFDSDLIACGRFDLEGFARDGQTALFESRLPLAAGQKPSRWHLTACQLLDEPVPSGPGGAAIDHVAQPFVFSQAHVRSLHDWLERRYARPWWQSILDLPLGQWSEFMIYGGFVRHHLDYAGVFRRSVRDGSFWLETRDQFQVAESLIERAFDDPACHFICLQADDHQHWTLDRFADTVRAQMRAHAGAFPADRSAQALA